MPTAKPIPPLTLDNITPPNRNYAYFQDNAAFPFEDRAQSFSLTNAWWLMEAAFLAYAEEAFARPRFEAAGFDHIQFINGQSTQCYLLNGDHFAVLVFRGTESNIQEGLEALDQFISDVKTDFDFWLKETPGMGKIHQGFDRALDEVWTDVLAGLDQLADRPLWITGHSLGGALATLAAARYGKARAVYTYGSPRVGDSDFKHRFQTPAYRLVHHNDVVAKVPPRPYRHIGLLYRLDAQGRLVPGDQTQKADFRISWKKFTEMISAIRTSKPSPVAVIPEGLRNHTPLLYALHIWNNLVGAY